MVPKCPGLLSAGQPHGARDPVQDRAYHAGTQGFEAGGQGPQPNGRDRLGPKGTFEHGHIGTLTRRVPADRVVSAVPPGRGTPKRPQEPKTPRVAELLRKALEWRALLKSGEGLTRARVTQILGLLRLAPEIQHHILSMPRTVGCPTISKRVLWSITMVLIRSSNSTPSQPSCRSRTHLHRDGR